MQDALFALSHFLESTFRWFLVSFGWLPVTIFSVVLGVGCTYWLGLQGKYTARAKERGELV
jgi:hypothetical protein